MYPNVTVIAEIYYSWWEWWWSGADPEILERGGPTFMSLRCEIFHTFGDFWLRRGYLFNFLAFFRPIVAIMSSFCENCIVNPFHGTIMLKNTLNMYDEMFFWPCKKGGGGVWTPWTHAQRQKGGVLTPWTPLYHAIRIVSWASLSILRSSFGTKMPRNCTRCTLETYVSACTVSRWRASASKHSWLK